MYMYQILSKLIIMNVERQKEAVPLHPVPCQLNRKYVSVEKGIPTSLGIVFALNILLPEVCQTGGTRNVKLCLCDITFQAS